MSYLNFLRENARWLAGGFLLTLFSSFGQTFFISLSAGEIRAEYGLSHGTFGTLYMVATLASVIVGFVAARSMSNYFGHVATRSAGSAVSPPRPCAMRFWPV